jgi:hypothetical protein
MADFTVSSLLALPVRLHGIQLGRPVDVLVDERGERVVGLEVLCGDGARRFLPFAVARIRPDEVAVESALMLLDERDLEYYRARTRRLAETRLVDPRIDDRGSVHSTRTAA